MAARRVNYARVYSYGTDGNAALAAGAPIASVRPMEPIRARSAPIRSKRASKRRLGLRLPVWSVVLALAAAVFMLSFILLGIRSDATQAAKQISALHLELDRAQEIIDSLELQIAEANDPQRIHSIAVNRLNMRQPTDEQIRVVPKPYVAQTQTYTAAAEQEGGGIFRMLLSMVGL